MDKNHEQFCIPKTLEYDHGLENTMKLRLRQPRRQEYQDEKSWEIATCVASFLMRTRWCADEQEAERGTPGITWSELYILFKIHGPKKCQSKNVVSKKSLLTEMAVF